MRTLALIPARAGSKGIPHKNTREFKGLPLLAHAIRVGQATCDQTWVSTEDTETAILAASYGAKVLMRPEELAQDETPMLPVIQHALANVEDKPDVVVLLQPSSPSVDRIEHVRAALRYYVGGSSVASVVRIPDHYSPSVAVVRKHHGNLCLVDGSSLDASPKRRQDYEPAYYRDGTVYLFWTDCVRNGDRMYGGECRMLEIPERDSVTLDTEEDWALAEAKHG